MENFKEAFIRTATKYADYVGMKISEEVNIKVIPTGSEFFSETKLKPGEIIPIENKLEAEKVLYEEMRTLNQTAEILGTKSSLAADPEKKDQPQVKKVLTYKDGRPAYTEKEI